MAYQIILKDSVLEDLRQICLGVYDAGQKLTVEELLEKMMDHPEVPIHYPYHHFIMPVPRGARGNARHSQSPFHAGSRRSMRKLRHMRSRCRGGYFYECLDPDNAGFRKDLAVV